MLTVTPVSETNQCAEMERIALGLSISTPTLFQRAVYAFSARVFIGLPCPINMAKSITFTKRRPESTKYHASGSRECFHPSNVAVHPALKKSLSARVRDVASGIEEFFIHLEKRFGLA